MTFYFLDKPRLTANLDAEERRALDALVQRTAALAPLIRQALVVRLQLGALLVAYLLAAVAIAAGLSNLIGRF
ncbi:MAG: hypothetical protein ACXU82_08515 [Caulobacteraceae bacterium]